MKHSYFLPLAFILALSVSPGSAIDAQNLISGVVSGEDGKALIAATVTLHQPGESDIIAFALTDVGGKFEITTSLTGQLEIRTRALGRQTDTLRVQIPIKEPLQISLPVANNELPEAIVRVDRLAITEKGDTTTFNVGEFRDSTDRKIEEVLRKLPGVRVKEDGSIEVNGKPLHRLLVEGSDLFGQDYQLGSKNINARDIGTIEVVDNYEANPILQSVNNSEAIILNLKLEEDVKSTLAGTAILGAGYGTREAKYAAYASLYRIARKQKTIFIGNADNVATNYGFSSTNGNDLGGNKGDIRSIASDPIDLYYRPDIQTVGLRPPFTDNSDQRFGTIRSDNLIGANLTINTSATIEARNSRQITMNTQRFVADSTQYALNSAQQWRRDDLFGQADLLATYISPGKNTSVETYLKAEGSGTDVFEQYQTGIDSFTYAPELQFSSLTARVRANHALQPGRVLQFIVNVGRTRQSFALDNLPPAINRLEEIEALVLDYGLIQQVYNGKVNYLHQSKRMLLNLTTEGGRHSLGEAGADRRYVSSGAGVNYIASNRLKLRGLAKLSRQTFRGQPSPNGLGYHLNAAATYGKNSANEAVLSVVLARKLPGAIRQLNQLAYLYDPFQIVLPSNPIQFGRNNSVSFRYNKRDNYQLENWTFVAQYSASDNLPAFTGKFLDEVVVAQYNYNQRRSRASMNGRYSKFSSALKNDVAISFGTSFSETELTIGGEEQSIRFFSPAIQLETGIVLYQHLRIKGNTRLTIQRLLSGSEGTFSRISTDLLAIYRLKRGQVVAGTSGLAAGGGGARQRAVGAYLGFDYDVSLGDRREIRFTSRLYNPFGTRTYTSQSVGDLFYFATSIPALPRYFIIKVDLSI